jgi:hypothetical protein
MFSVLWAITGEVESFSSNNLFGLYLADTGRPISVRNNYPMVSAPYHILVEKLYELHKREFQLSESSLRCSRYARTIKSMW